MSIEGADDQVDQQDSHESLEEEARSMGWLPESEFKGNKERWVDAEEYVNRGRQVMPILLANNKRLQKELLTRDKKIDTMQASLDAATVALTKLEKHYTAANARAVEEAKSQLRDELKKAREDEDVDAELQILDKLNELKSQPEPVKPVAATTSPDDAMSPEFKEWLSENPWFNTDTKRAKALVRIAEDLREEGETLVGKAFFDLCLEKLEGPARVPEPSKVSKVEGGSRGSSTNRGRSFSDLPAEAKQACWEDAEDLVGPNKRYATKAEWEKAYAKIYFGEG